MPTLTIRDETATGTQTAPDFDLEFSTGSITARELIQRRVEEEVRHYNLDCQNGLRSLVTPKPAETVLNGLKLRKSATIDVEAQVERAVKAFESNGFFVLVDNVQVSSLDEKIQIGMRTRVTFIKLVPLVGG